MARPKLRNIEPTGALAERQLPDGRRRIKLTRQERFAMERRQKAEAAAALFLDLKEERTWASIAEELELSPSQLKDLTKSQEFDEVYNAMYAELGHDPRYRATMAALGDMLPMAVDKLRLLLTSSRTPPGILLKAVEKVMELNAVTKPEHDKSDRTEMINFLMQNNISVENMGIAIPPQYLEAMQAMNEVVDGALLPDNGTDPQDSSTPGSASGSSPDEGSEP